MKPAVIMALMIITPIVALAAYTKNRGPGADIRVPKTLTKVFYDRVPEFECPPGQRVVWESAREIGCEG